VAGEELQLEGSLEKKPKRPPARVGFKRSSAEKKRNPSGAGKTRVQKWSGLAHDQCGKAKAEAQEVKNATTRFAFRFFKSGLVRSRAIIPGKEWTPACSKKNRF